MNDEDSRLGKSWPFEDNCIYEYSPCSSVPVARPRKVPDWRRRRSCRSQLQCRVAQHRLSECSFDRALKQLKLEALTFER